MSEMHVVLYGNYESVETLQLRYHFWYLLNQLFLRQQWINE